MTDDGHPEDDSRLEGTADRLRRAFEAHTAGIEPDPASFRHIEERLASGRRLGRRHAAVLGAAAAALLLVVGILVVGDDGDPQVDTAGEVTTTTTTTGPTTTAAPTSTTSATTSTTAFAPTTDPTVPIFPAVDSARRFGDPVAAAVSFATDFVGFTDPIVGDFLEGDSRSGEVEVRTRDDGPVTRVLLRLLDDDTWGVIGAATDDITPETPEVDDVVTSPVTVAGFALAFEGTINVDVREQGAVDAIGEGFVTAGGTPPGDVYEGEIEFSEPSRSTGAVLYRVFSAEDGSVEYAAATRVQFSE